MHKKYAKYETVLRNEGLDGLDEIVNVAELKDLVDMGIKKFHALNIIKAAKAALEEKRQRSPV